MPLSFVLRCLSFTSYIVVVIAVGGAVVVNGVLQVGAADVELRLAAGEAARVSYSSAGIAAIVGSDML